MNPLLILNTALSSIGTNKLRAGLTLLGIVIGVAAVVSLMAIGRGAQETVTSRITALGTNLLFVRPGAATEGGFVFGQGTAQTLTLKDALAINDRVFAPDVVAVAPETSTPSFRHCHCIGDVPPAPTEMRAIPPAHAVVSVGCRKMEAGPTPISHGIWN